MDKELMELGFERYENCSIGLKQTWYKNFGIGSRIMVALDDNNFIVYLKDEHYNGEDNIRLHNIKNIDQLKQLVKLLVYDNNH